MAHDVKFEFDNEKDEVRVSCCGGDWTGVFRGANQAVRLSEAVNEHKRPWKRIGCIPVYEQVGP